MEVGRTKKGTSGFQERQSMFTYMRLHSIPIDLLFVSENSQGETKQDNGTSKQACCVDCCIVLTCGGQRASQPHACQRTVASHLRPPNGEALHGTRARTYQSSLVLKRNCLIMRRTSFPALSFEVLAAATCSLKLSAVSASEGRHIKCFRMPSVESRSTGLQTDKSSFVSASASTFTSRLRRETADDHPGGLQTPPRRGTKSTLL